MNIKALLIPVLAATAPAIAAFADDKAPAAAQVPARHVVMDELPPGAVRIEDKFWSPKLKRYRQNTIPGWWPHLATPLAALAGAATPEKKPVKGHTLWIEANVHKILEAAAWALLQEPNAELERKVNETIALIAAAQQPDGYVDARVITDGSRRWDMNSHDGYTIGFLMEAAVAHYRATGRKDLPEVACRAADCAWRHFVERKTPGFPGCPEIELALGDLYRATGNRKYVDLLRTLIEARGQHSPAPGSEYIQNHAPIRQQNDIRGHAVMAVFFQTTTGGNGGNR